MSSHRKAKFAFALALLLLGLSGIAAGVAIDRFYVAQTWVRHSYMVELAIGELESAFTTVGRFRVLYVDGGTPESLKSFQDAVSYVGAVLARIRQLTADNPAQQAICDLLQKSVDQRLAPQVAAVELKRQDRSDSRSQVQFAFAAIENAFSTEGILKQMRQNESVLLEQRRSRSIFFFYAIPVVFGVSFLLSGLMFWLHYQLLNRELQQRTAAENQLHSLSVELMRVQDEEHRRFARELHDGLGQTLTGGKMLADALFIRNARNPEIGELASLLGDAVSQTRTMSHLFYAPQLDEIGFTASARELVEKYGQYTGVAVAANLPQPVERLPRSLEHTLFRVLQEALNNIHRHAKSSKAEVGVERDANRVTLRVRDYGLGIPLETLTAFRSNGKQTGLGLAGMKERVREQGGTLEVRSDGPGKGTEIIATMPLGNRGESPALNGAP